MPLKVVHISGPARSGKTTLARALAARRSDGKPHHLRLHAADTADASTDDSARPSLRLAVPLEEMATSTCRSIRPELVFEDIPAELSRIGRRRSSRLVFLETDNQPCFRHAFSYDVRVFVMLAPADPGEVFRSAEEAEAAAQRAMNDTGEFASEIFGLTREGPDLSPRDLGRPAAARAARSDGAGNWPTAVGTHIAAQLLLQPSYHSIVDSDVVILNCGVGADGDVAERCAARIGRMLARLRQEDGQSVWFAACDPLDGKDPLGQRALERIDTLIDVATAARS